MVAAAELVCTKKFMMLQPLNYHAPQLLSTQYPPLKYKLMQVSWSIALHTWKSVYELIISSSLHNNLVVLRKLRFYCLFFCL